MTPSANVTLLAAAVQRHLGDGPFKEISGWTHMGAVICDSVLQAGLNYEHTVRPRIEELQRAWPDADTVTGFRKRLNPPDDLKAVLRMNNQRKLATIPTLADHLAAAGIDTRDQLRAWLEEPEHRQALRLINGIGPKTVDYIRSLTGHPAVAVDVHLRNFAIAAGVTDTSYEGLRTVYEETADHLGHHRGAMEHAVWKFMSGKGKPSSGG